MKRNIDIETASKLLKTKPDFGICQVAEIKNRVETGSFFGFLDANYLDLLCQQSGLTAVTWDEFLGYGMEEGETRNVQIFDRDGHGFWDSWEI